MEMKTRLGISVGLMGAAIYLMVLFGGYVPAILLAGYVLLFESNAWLKKTAVKAVAIGLFFSILTAVIGLVPNAFSLINSLCGIFGGSFYVGFIDSFISLLNGLLNIAEKLLLLLMAFVSLHQGNISFGFIDRLIEDHIKTTNE